MKRKTTAIFSVLSALLLLSVAAVYAHGVPERTNEESINGMMMNVQDMDEMHDLMTKDLDPKLREQMDIMHDECTSQFKKQGNNKEQMEEVNMMGINTFNGMMGMRQMMG